MTVTHQFDAIVIGSGITGGWAAKELTEKGLKVLLLERGRDIKHIDDYIGEHKPSWEVPFRGKPLRELYKEEYAVQSTTSAFDETTRHFFNNDKNNPYIRDDKKPFKWFRADGVGGKSLIWGRQTYRWSDLDFEANKKDGTAIDWPIRYEDIKDWYSYVEKFAGISGQTEGLAHLPDGEFLPPMAMNTIEKIVKQKIEENFDDRIMTIGRVAVLTKEHNGRAACHYCGICTRGCSTGSYFSSQSSTLPAAVKTGNLTLISDSVVHSLIYDKAQNRVSAVRVVNAKTKQAVEYSAKLVFMCASTIGSTQIMLNSKSAAFPAGIANSSGVMGHFLMDHFMINGAWGTMPGHLDKYYYGDRPNGIYVPRFQNVPALNTDKDTDFLRGYGFQGGAWRPDWKETHKQPGFGADFKDKLQQAGPWTMNLGGFGEVLPNYSNKLSLDSGKIDRFGIPLVKFDFTFGDNEKKMAKDLVKQATAMLKTAGLINIVSGGPMSVPGQTIHEMGTARMGHSPESSVLNKFNQAHDVPNLFVTDGACMTSASCVNPSLTYMALTARACDYAVDQLKAGQI